LATGFGTDRDFQSVVWATWAITVIFVGIRIVDRIKVFKRLYWDDFLVLLALALTLVSAVLWQAFVARDFYRVMNTLAGIELPPRPGLTLDTTRRALRGLLVIYILFYSALYSIKFSFLIFFRRLGHNVRRQNLLSWSVWCSTIASYIISIGLIPYQCLANSSSRGHCGTKPVIRHLLVSAILDVLTDLAS
jgi:hypothetical protein